VDKIVWSPEAIEDLQSIAAYIERDSEYYARAVVGKILEASRNLADFPMLGRIVPELDDDKTRERFVYSYRLVYRIEREKILIIAIIHGKRLFDNLSTRL
jgi:toxin ParE1/3/4